MFYMFIIQLYIIFFYILQVLPALHLDIQNSVLQNWTPLNPILDLISANGFATPNWLILTCHFELAVPGLFFILTFLAEYPCPIKFDFCMGDHLLFLTCNFEMAACP